MMICIIDSPTPVIPILRSDASVLLVKDPVPEYTAATASLLNEMILTCAVDLLPEKPRYLNRAERRKLHKK